jgi:hypothetical protein
MDFAARGLTRMNRTESFVFGLVVGIAALYATMHFTVVRARDGFHVIPKITAKLDMPYADVRAFKLEQWQRRPSLAMSILKVKKGYLLEDRSLVGFRSAAQQMLDQFAMGTKTSPTRF